MRGSCHVVTDDQQDVGSACERQDGKRVVRGSNAKHCVDGVVTELELTLFSDSVVINIPFFKGESLL